MSEEFESGALDPTAAEPKTYGDSQFLESLDPPKPDEPLPFEQTVPASRRPADERDRTAGERNIIDVIQFQDGKGHVQDGNKTVSPEHAADELKAYRERKAAVADQQLGEQLAAAVDEFRGVPQEQPEPQPIAEPDFQPQPEYAPAAPTELDNLLQDLPAERRAPFVEAYNQHLQNAQAQAKRNTINILPQAQSYAAAISGRARSNPGRGRGRCRGTVSGTGHRAARTTSQAILAHIGRTDPQRYQAIKAHVSQVKELAGNQIAKAQQ